MSGNRPRRIIVAIISLSLLTMATFPPSSQAAGITASSGASSITVNPGLHTGDYLGTVSIPAIKSINPIYEGTGASELKKGVGHFNGSVLPGVVDNSVLAGHRDTVFSKLTKLKIGDVIIVDVLKGKFTYKVSKFRIVIANDKTVIVPTKSAVLTLATCYPFDFNGNAPRRFIVSADLIASGETSKKI